MSIGGIWVFFFSLCLKLPLNVPTLHMYHRPMYGMELTRSEAIPCWNTVFLLQSQSVLVHGIAVRVDHSSGNGILVSAVGGTLWASWCPWFSSDLRVAGGSMGLFTSLIEVHDFKVT